MATDLCLGIPSPVRSATENLVFRRNVGGLLPTPTRQLALRSSFYNGGAILLPDAVTATASRITMRVASKNAYICRDCGYIYNDRKPFEKLPDDYFCPVCSASKKRFRPYQDVVEKNANDLKARKARKEKLKQVDSAIGSVLPIGVAIGVLALIGVYIYVNQI